MQNFLELMNPLSSRYNACADLNKLSPLSYVTVIFVTTIASLLTAFLGTALVFRLLVGRLKPIELPPAKPTPLTDTASKVADSAKDLLDGTHSATPLAPPPPAVKPPLTNTNSNEITLASFFDGTRTLKKKEPVAEIPRAPTPPQVKVLPTKKSSSTLTLESFFDGTHSLNSKKMVLANGVIAETNQTSGTSELTLPLKKNSSMEDLKKLLEQKNSLNEEVENFKQAHCIQEEEEGSGEIEKEALALAEKEEVDFGFENISMESSLFFNRGVREALGLNPEECNLTSYLSTLTSDWSVATGVQETPITFKDGHIVPIDPSDEEGKKLALKKFLHILKETYGTELSHVVTYRYKLNEEVLTLETIKKALIGVAANVKASDLEKLFAEIKKDEISRYRASELLKKIDFAHFEAIKAKSEFKELSSEDIQFLLRAFKTYQLSDSNEIQSIAGNLSWTLSEKSNSDFCLIHDIGLLATLSEWNDLRLELDYEAALSEYIGKTVSYHELKEGMVITLPRKDNTFCFYKVASKLAPKKDAVISFLFVPLMESQDLDPSNGPNVHLTFRGTMPGVNDLDSGGSLYRDQDWTGIGRRAFKARKPEILDMVTSYLEDAKPSQIHISGHSLGACDTQRGLAFLASHYANAEETNPLKKIKGLHAAGHNPPRANPTVNLVLKKAVAKISKQEKPIDMSLLYVRYFDKNYEDIVQKCGDVLAGTDTASGPIDGNDEVFKNALFFKRRMIEITMNEENDISGILPRHTTRALNKRRYPETFALKKLDCTNEEDRKDFDKIAARRFEWDEKNYSSMQKVLYGVAWYSSYLVRTPKNYLVRLPFHGFCYLGLEIQRLMSSDPQRRHI